MISKIYVCECKITTFFYTYQISIFIFFDFIVMTSKRKLLLRNLHGI